MLVICLDNKDYPLSLHVNKIYKATEDGDYYLIVDDNLEDCRYPKNIFEIKENTDKM